MKLKAFFARAFCVGAIGMVTAAASAETIQLNMTGTIYDSGTNTTTFNYDVLLLSSSQTPGSAVLFDVDGFVAGSQNFVANSGVTGLASFEFTSVAPGNGNPILTSGDDASKYNVRVTIGSLNTGELSLGTLSYRSTINAFSTSDIYDVASLDHKMNGSLQITNSTTQGPALNGVGTTPLPAAALGALPLLSALGLKRSRRTK